MMPNWAEVLNEINAYKPENVGPIDVVRRRYLAKLHDYTKRNVIAYYSGWLQVGGVVGVDINDMDMNGFMTCIHGLDCSKGLDLILHTSGGSISAAEQLVYYLKSKFRSNIRAIVPQIAMSAGTMMACACKEIVMGKQSCLGPFDPLIGGVSAFRVIKEFKHAIDDVKKNPNSIHYWQTIIKKYHPTFLDSCKLACERSKDIVTEWLKSNMFYGMENADNLAKNVVKHFHTIGKKFDHDRHISIDECEKCGLKISRLEDDQTFQDLVLTVHHTFIHTLAPSSLVKVIENHLGIGMFNFRKQA